MNGESQQPISKRLSELASFLAIFESQSFSFGEWQGGDGQMPWFAMSEDAQGFFEMTYNAGWVVPNFDWAAWARTDDAQRFMDDPRVIESASVEDLEHLLTAIVRADRFNEGSLADTFEAGHLTNIVRRANSLLRELTV